ncbi:MAG: 50S ribosomal protein L35 [Candidatus Stahlbacteria bacterium]|nr:50S ribosomal protein L35 [Candidatus Stahlbacteria bacterium]
MPKVKTNRSAKKRFKKCANSIKRKQGYHGHLLTGKTRKRKRNLAKMVTVSKADKKRIKKLIPY